MKKNLAKCGIDCSQCGALKANAENNNILRKQTAEEWSRQFGVQIDPASVDCGGCQQNEILFNHCKVCEIRSCAQERGLSTCAACPDYGCEKLAAIWAHDPAIKANLESLRK